MGNQTGKNPPPKQGAFRRDRSSKNNQTGVSRSGSIAGKITKKLWNVMKGWDNPGR
jgi:hypothetical protein